MAKGRSTQFPPIHTNYFTGGVTVDPKLGIANSFYQSQNLDFRTKPSQISVLPGPSQLSDTLSDLITAMDQDVDGVRYGIGDAGHLYKIDTDDTITDLGTLNEDGSAGLLYNQVSDQLYIPGQTAVSLYGRATIDTSPSLLKDQWAKSASTAPGCTNLYTTSGFFDGSARNNAASIGVGITSTSQVTNNATKTYTLPDTISETSGAYCFFAPDIEPFYSIAIYISAVGTGDWTLTLHDALNNELAAVTITHANVATGWNEFVFGKQVRGFVNASQTGGSATYHFHLTSSVASDTATASVITASDLSTCDFLLFAYRLVQPVNKWHPTALFTGAGRPLLCIGNAGYLATYDFSNDKNPTNAQFQRHRLTFKTGFEACGITTNNQYLIIAVERRSNDSTRNYQDGALYFWDGTTNAPSMVIDVPMGAPYGLATMNNITYFACAGSLYAWSGGQTVIKVRKLAYQNTDYLNTVDHTIVNPNMFTNRYGLLLMGYPSTTTNKNIDYGVWSWGSVELTFPNSYCQSYTLSNSQLNLTSTNALAIGCAVNFVDNLYVSWKYYNGSATVYGLDELNNSSTPASTFSWSSLIYDGSASYKQKLALRLKVTFLALPADTTLKAWYALDRGAHQLTASAGVGDTSIVIDIPNGRFNEIQYGFQGTCTSSATDPPTVIGVTLEVNPLTEEFNLTEDN